MRVFVVGATGAIGSRLIPLLVSAGHSVIGLTRTPEKVEAIRRAGADAAVAMTQQRDLVVTLAAKYRLPAVYHSFTFAGALIWNLSHLSATPPQRGRSRRALSSRHCL